MRTKITIKYKTSRGTECDTYSEALVMEAIEDEPGLYLEMYRKDAVVKAILSNLTVRIKKPKESENEPTEASKGCDNTETEPLHSSLRPPEDGEDKTSGDCC